MLCFIRGIIWTLLVASAIAAVTFPSDSWSTDVLVKLENVTTIPSGLDLKLMKVVTTNLSKNEAISPFVMSSLMTQIWLGAAGTTRDEMTPVLDLTGSTPDDFLPAYHSAIDDLSSGASNITTGVYNGIYVAGTFTAKETFADLLTSYFHAGVQTYSYPSSAAEKINRDVANVTENRIKDLVTVDDLGDAVLVLVSALYFKGDWQYPFESDDWPSRFLTADGDKDVNMMSLEEKTLPYAAMDTFDVVALPYSDTDYCMVLIRPLERSMTAVAALKDSLDTLNITDIMGQLRETKVVMKMPRFEIEADYSMKEAFQALGIKELFYPGADLSGISDMGLYVSKIKHKVFIKVTEQGTEAAGAAAAGIAYYSASRFQLFNLDRPFFAVVYNKRHQVNMFSAYVASPSADEIGPKA